MSQRSQGLQQKCRHRMPAFSCSPLTDAGSRQEYFLSGKHEGQHEGQCEEVRQCERGRMVQ